MNDKKRRNLEQFRQGQKDRKEDAGCRSSNGRYLEGWYAPDKVLPDFLTMNELKELEP